MCAFHVARLNYAGEGTPRPCACVYVARFNYAGEGIYLRCGTSAYTVSTLRVVLRKGRDPDGGAIEPGCDGDHSSHKSKIVCKEKSTQKPALSLQNSCCGLHK